MNIAVSGFNEHDAILLKCLKKEFTIHEAKDTTELKDYLLNQSLFTLPDLALIHAENSSSFKNIRAIKSQPLLKGLIIVILTSSPEPAMYTLAKELKVNDLFLLPVDEKQLAERLKFLVKFQLMRPTVEQLMSSSNEISYHLPLGKRLFDIAFSGILLILLSPVLLIIAALIRLESRGPIIYKSKRTGTGYQVFDFYKFRSMQIDADKKLDQLKAFNQYNTESKEEETPQNSAFIKIKNDPRITRIGTFIRNTSIDEIPQLFNILKGDMSVVGNRPLPLYEAEQLTSNDWAMRFVAPAGLTGLWQIKKRGTSDMSERERKKLDNFYAEKYSWLFDLKILFGTVSALLQKEKV